MHAPLNSEAFRIVGTPRFGGILVVADHASNRVPEDIDLGIAPELMDEHIAIDIGVTGIAEHMAKREGTAALLGNVSRLSAIPTAPSRTRPPSPTPATAIPSRAISASTARRGWRGFIVRFTTS